MAYRRYIHSPSSEGAEGSLYKWVDEQARKEEADEQASPGEVEEYAEENEAASDPLFKEEWYQYLEDNNLYEDYQEFCAVKRKFLNLIQGPVAAEWMRQAATSLMAEAMREDQLLSFPFRPFSPALSHQSEEVLEPAAAAKRRFDKSRAGPDEARQYMSPAEALQYETSLYDEFVEDEVASLYREVPSTSELWPGAQSPATQKSWDHELPGEAEQYADQEPDEAEQYVEDDDAISVQSEEDDDERWTMPGKAEQYAAPGKAEGQYAAVPALQVAPSGGPTWEQIVHTARQDLATSQTVAQQAQLWDARPGVPMDTSAGRTRMSKKAAVCFHCRLPGHIRSQCDNRNIPRARVTKIQSLRLLASRIRAAQSCGHDLRKGDNVTVPPVTLTRKVGPGLQDIQKQARRILAERNAEKAEENTWIGRMVAAESIGELDGLIKSRAA